MVAFKDAKATKLVGVIVSVVAVNEPEELGYTLKDIIKFEPAGAPYTDALN
jgi:hypothetical protein